ncbi:hypothetical protein IFM46972_08238 [Aspergillus udagawae]|uniref:Uncharacterized protein n=1 Tax=Aspergillus udagawae TaxID=91492 RepID=A0A8H3P622_9EURO|nr:hypothetical protein IFM46972_08238 [Aspergillus udagawae]
MSNRILEMSDLDEFPYCIWYSSVPHVATCEELLRCMPSMKLAVVRVCILRNYSDYWHELDADPDVNLMEDARKSPNLRFQGIVAKTLDAIRLIQLYHGSVCSSIPPPVSLTMPDEPYADIEMGVPNNGRGANMAYVELCVLVPDEEKNIALEVLEETGGFEIAEYYKFLGENRYSTQCTEF